MANRFTFNPTPEVLGAVRNKLGKLAFADNQQLGRCTDALSAIGKLSLEDQIALSTWLKVAISIPKEFQVPAITRDAAAAFLAKSNDLQECPFQWTASQAIKQPPYGAVTVQADAVSWAHSTMLFLTATKTAASSNYLRSPQKVKALQDFFSVNNVKVSVSDLLDFTSEQNVSAGHSARNPKLPEDKQKKYNFFLNNIRSSIRNFVPNDTSVSRYNKARNVRNGMDFLGKDPRFPQMDSSFSTVLKWEQAFREYEVPFESLAAYGQSRANHWKIFFKDAQLRENDIFEYKWDTTVLVSDVFFVKTPASNDGNAIDKSDDDGDQSSKWAYHNEQTVKLVNNWVSDSVTKIIILKLFPTIGADGSLSYNFSALKNKTWITLPKIRASRLHNGELIIRLTSTKTTGSFVVNNSKIFATNQQKANDAYIPQMIAANTIRSLGLFLPLVNPYKYNKYTSVVLPDTDIETQGYLRSRTVVGKAQVSTNYSDQLEDEELVEFNMETDTAEGEEILNETDLSFEPLRPPEVKNEWPVIENLVDFFNVKEDFDKDGCNATGRYRVTYEGLTADVDLSQKDWDSLPYFVAAASTAGINLEGYTVDEITE